jgi:Ca2+-transporting ATPase
MNYLFSTAPLSLNQALVCMAVALPMTLVAMLANRINPQA